jgi:hypothetical protein
MGKRIFELETVVTYQVELDDAVIDAVDDAWRADLYDLNTPEEIAGMVGRCLLMGWKLNGMDGWADQPSENAKMIGFPEYKVDSVREIKA